MTRAARTISKPGVGVGTKFRSVIADANVLFRVTKSRGRGVWEAVAENEPSEINGKMYDSDFAGTVRVFTTREISAVVGWETFLAKTADASGGYYASLKPGQIVHYDNAFGEFLRCEVVVVPKGAKTAHNLAPGEHALRPIAMVGNWRGSDLPRRLSDGRIELGYQAKKIQEGDLFRPHYGNIYESPAYTDKKKKGGLDPRKLTPIKFDVPPMTDKEAAKAALVTAADEASAALDKAGDNPAAALRAAKAIIDAALALTR